MYFEMKLWKNMFVFQDSILSFQASSLTPEDLIQPCTLKGLGPSDRWIKFFTRQLEMTWQLTEMSIQINLYLTS